MAHEEDTPVANQIEQEIRRGRKFTPHDLLAQMAGPGALKGASPVSLVEQAENEIATWLGSHLNDTFGMLRMVLHRHLKGSNLLLDNLDQPIAALASYCRRVLSIDHLLQDIVREADLEWGRAMDERPYFEREGSAADPDDPYTVEGVRHAIEDALASWPTATGAPKS